MNTPPQPIQKSSDTAPQLDFDAEMQALAQEAAAVSPANPDPARLPPPVSTVSTVSTVSPVLPSTPTPEPPPVPTPAVDLTPVLDALNRMGSMETANRQLFDALHSELRQYRDGFLFESLHLPVIRDLISLLDDMESVRCQVGVLLPGTEGAGLRARGEVARALERTTQNIENTIHFLREILLRMEVQEVREADGTFDRAVHRQVGVALADAENCEGRVASVVRCGFTWRSRTLRQAEVIVHRTVPPQA